MVSQIADIAVYAIALIAAFLGLLSYLVMRRIRKNGKKNLIEHEEIRQEFKLGDTVLEVRIKKLEDRK